MCKKILSLLFVLFTLSLLFDTNLYAQGHSHDKDKGSDSNSGKIDWDEDRENGNNVKVKPALPGEDKNPHSCTHDFNKYRYELTPEQESKLKEIREELDKKTVGNNPILVAHYQKLLYAAVKNNPSYHELLQKVNTMQKTIDWAHKEFRRRKLEILTDEQREIEKEREKAEHDHFAKCAKKGKPDSECSKYKNYDYLWKEAQKYGAFGWEELLKKNALQPSKDDCCSGKENSNHQGIAPGHLEEKGADKDGDGEWHPKQKDKDDE